MSKKIEKILVLAARFEKKANTYREMYDTWYMKVKQSLERRGLSILDFDDHQLQQAFDRWLEDQGHLEERLDKGQKSYNEWGQEITSVKPGRSARELMEPEAFGDEPEREEDLETPFYRKDPLPRRLEMEEMEAKGSKDSKKLDPKAKVRNRGSVCVPAESAKDKKDHFPINDADQARNALARVHQYTKVPEWYSGSLKGLQALVARKVKAKYPKIDVGGKDSKKKKSAYYDVLIAKFAQETPDYSAMRPDQLANYSGPQLSQLLQFNMISPQQYQAALESQRVAREAKPPQVGIPGEPPLEMDLPAGNVDEEGNAIRQPVSFQRDYPKAAPLAYREDVHTAQQKLNSMIMSGKLNAKALDPDGKLGTLTKGVLKAYKDSVGIPHLTDEEAIKALNTAPEAQAPVTPSTGTPAKTWGGGGGIVREFPE